MNKSTLKMLIISVIIIVITILICLIFSNSNSNQEEYEHLRNYEVNEYIATYVSSDDLAKIYLNDYLYNMRYNVKEAYNSLDSKYRSKKFGSLENYNNYIQTFLSKSISAKKFIKESKSGYTFFKVYDQYDNIYIFKTKGIMQYSLFLDEDTVEVR